MTNEEAKIIIGNIPIYGDECYSINEYQEAKTMAIKTLGSWEQYSDKLWKNAYERGKAEALEQQPKTEQFARWVAKEIFDEWEYNQDSFAEIACRKLAKLGIVRENGNEWELVEPQESEDKE